MLAEGHGRNGRDVNVFRLKSWIRTKKLMLDEGLHVGKLQSGGVECCTYMKRESVRKSKKSRDDYL